MKYEAPLKPFIKWAGGKQALSNLLLSEFPTKFNRLYEPFVGGGSVFLSLRNGKSTISDQNHWLISTYRAIRQNWEIVAEHLNKLNNTKENFLKIRSIPPSSLDLFQKAAHFIYLNKTCFRGLFRVNKKGMFNVPYGDYDRRYFDPDNLNAVSRYLQSVEIRHGDFELSTFDVQIDDFIYFDPPYYKVGGYSDFNRYTENKFNETDHIRLAAFCRELDSRGITWALSNSDTPFIRHLFDGFKLCEVTNRREINLNSKNRKITELLIKNY